MRHQSTLQNNEVPDQTLSDQGILFFQQIYFQNIQSLFKYFVKIFDPKPISTYNLKFGREMVTSSAQIPMAIFRHATGS